MPYEGNGEDGKHYWLTPEEAARRAAIAVRGKRPTANSGGA